MSKVNSQDASGGGRPGLSGASDDGGEHLGSSSLPSSGESPSLSSSLQSAVSLVSTSPDEAVRALSALQGRISSAAVFSRNEGVDDVPTSSLPLLAVEYHLGSALVASPTKSSIERRENVSRSVAMFHDFLRRLDDLGALSADEETRRDYHGLLDADEELHGEVGDGGGARGPPARPPVGESREGKIARFRRKKAMDDELARLEAIRQRRVRLGAAPDEDVDGSGYDEEGLARSTHLAQLRLLAMRAIEEIHQANRELEMLEMAVRMERERGDIERHRGGAPGEIKTLHSRPDANDSNSNLRSDKPMKVTKVTKDPKTGQLQFRREEIRSQVFRPGWNLPTMTLAELGEKERAQALERAEKQRQSEEEAKLQPRRYEQLVRDGMEDDADLVDASAELDRKWDRFKEENPRGSGNKLGDRGDRNF